MEAVTLAEIRDFDPRPARHGGRARYLCPLSGACRDKPRDDSHRSLAVDEQSGVFICHRCGEKGRLREFWERKNGDKPLISMNLRQSSAAPPPKAESLAEKRTNLTLLREKMEKFAREFADSPAQNYLHERGIPAAVSQAAGCGYAAGWEHWRKNGAEWELAGNDERVVFPVLDEKHKLIAFHGRAIKDGYLNSSKISKGNKSRGVFRSSPDVFESPVIAICEGPADALALETCGVPAVAMIGTTAPKWLASALRAKSVLIATDADAAGDEAALKLSAALLPHARDVHRLRPLYKKDWAEELELFGAEKKREALAPFAPATDDVTRANSSWQFVLDGDHAAAEFVARLIDDTELRKAFLVLIHKEYVMAA